MINIVAAAGFLVFMGLEDLKEHAVSVWKIVLFLLGGFAGFLWQQTVVAGGGIWELGVAVCAVFPGAALLLMSRLSKGAVGPADGWVVLGLGLYLGFWKLLSVLMAAFFLAAVWAGIILLGKKRNRQEEIPFVPFLVLGMAVHLACAGY